MLEIAFFVHLKEALRLMRWQVFTKAKLKSGRCGEEDVLCKLLGRRGRKLTKRCECGECDEEANMQLVKMKCGVQSESTE
jgi:hypothetical protein